MLTLGFQSRFKSLRCKAHAVDLHYQSNGVDVRNVSRLL